MASSCLQTSQVVARAGLPSHLSVNNVNFNNSLQVISGQGRPFCQVNLFIQSHGQPLRTLGFKFPRLFSVSIDTVFTFKCYLRPCSLL